MYLGHRKMKRTSFILIFLSILIGIPSAFGQSVLMKTWEAEVHLNTLEGKTNEILTLYQMIENQNKNTSIIGFETEINALSAKYLPKPPIRLIPIGGKEEKEVTPKASITPIEGGSLITVTYPEPIEYDSRAKYELKFQTEGLFEKVDDKYVVALQLTNPTAITADKERVPLDVGMGTIRIHLPVGTKPISTDPRPWRIIWQGIGGYENHFVLVYDTFPYNKKINIQLEESPIVGKAAKVGEEIRNLDFIIKSSKNQTTVPREILAAEKYLFNAKIHLSRVTDNIITGDDEKVKTEMESALEFIDKTKISLGLKQAPEAVSKKPIELNLQELLIITIVLSIFIFGALILIAK
jgi:hypothetical protein